jgi:hypothetical protein
MTEAQTEKFESWVKLELMGRKVLIGKASEVLIAGAPLLRIDVPASGDMPAYTQMYGASAIYCITPITEEVALRAAPNYNVEPISKYELRPPTLSQTDRERLKNGNWGEAHIVGDDGYDDHPEDAEDDRDDDKYDDEDMPID